MKDDSIPIEPRKSHSEPKLQQIIISGPPAETKKKSETPRDSVRVSKSFRTVNEFLKDCDEDDKKNLYEKTKTIPGAENDNVDQNYNMDQKVKDKDKKNETVHRTKSYEDQRKDLPIRIKKGIKELGDFNNDSRRVSIFWPKFNDRKNKKNISEIETCVRKYEDNVKIGTVFKEDYEDDFEEYYEDDFEEDNDDY